MTKIEAVFGGVLLLAVVAAACFAVFQKGLPSFAKSNVSFVSQDGDANLGVFTGNETEDVCTCYESGYEDGSLHGNVDGSPDYRIDDSYYYKAGYSACRSVVGMDGGKAWAAGWTNGELKLRSQRKCTLYLKRSEAN